MALFGDLGKALGLGTAKQTLQGGLQGALRGAIMGQPFMGAAAGAATAGGTQFSQGTAVSVPQQPASETAFSGEAGISSDRGVLAPTYMPGLGPASFGGRMPMPPTAGGVRPANLPAIITGTVGATRSIGGMLGLAGGAIMAAPTIIDMVTGEEKKLRLTRS